MENRIMRRRGRPCKGSEDSRSVRRTKTLRLTDEETKVISDNALKCRMNFSEYCRKVLLGYRPCVPDPVFRDGLLAARKDMVNFINAIRGMKLTKEERAKRLSQIPTLKVWLNSMAAEIEFIDKQMERMLRMIARARAIAHGNAYTTYATLKENAQFICCENMAGT